MTISTILRDIMKKQEVSQVALGKRIGIKNDTLYQRLRHPNISINALTPMLRAMDYKLVIVPSNRQVRDDEYEVSMAEPEKEEQK